VQDAALVNSALDVGISAGAEYLALYQAYQQRHATASPDEQARLEADAAQLLDRARLELVRYDELVAAWARSGQEPAGSEHLTHLGLARALMEQAGSAINLNP
jgi:hypothetical protein